MGETKKLYEEISVWLSYQSKNFANDLIDGIASQLKHPLYTWQEQGLKNFIFWDTIHREKMEGEGKKNSNHIMFNMATGTGKTLMIAFLILYYYVNKGKNKFIFFVNQDNIIKKTVNNLTKGSHSKYLFTNNISIDGFNNIIIKEVENFSPIPLKNTIEIKFTTIQKLYQSIEVQRENQITIDELKKQDVVLIADEAHHLNANTLKLGKKEQENEKGWENTIMNKILNNGNDNMLLEFTATIPKEKSVQEKYNDKIIYNFGIPEFIKSQYTKWINLIFSELETKEIILQSLLFNWFRHRIALDNNIANFKPVILFKSKKIEESEDDYNTFLEVINSLTTTKVKELVNKMDKGDIIRNSENLSEQGHSRSLKLIKYIKEKESQGANIYEEIVSYLKNNFQERNLVLTNSKTKKDSVDEDRLNSLEEITNPIRAVFTVNRLTEGWDVLNLYDIVRLSRWQNSGGALKSTKSAEATIQERQLIGRWIRFYPFSYNNAVQRKRNFDGYLGNNMRFLEELFYYSYNDNRYISEIKKELIKEQFIDEDKTVVTHKFKDDFKKDQIYQNGSIFINLLMEQANPERSIEEELEKISIKKEIKNNDGMIRETSLSVEDKKEGFVENNSLSIEWKFKELKVSFKNFTNRHILYHAVNTFAKKDNSVFKFCNLKEKLQGITSIDDLFKEEYLWNIKIFISTNKYNSVEELSNDEQLDITISLLKEVEKVLKKTYKVWSEYQLKYVYDVFCEEKIKIHNKKDIERNKEYKDEIVKSDLYPLTEISTDTEENKCSIYLIRRLEELKEKRKDLDIDAYVIRNNEILKIYDRRTSDWWNWEWFQPDFILYINFKKDWKYYSVQLFVEVKGEHLLLWDQRKQDIITHINTKENISKVFKEKYLKKSEDESKEKIINREYILKWTSFYNESSKGKVSDELDAIFEDLDKKDFNNWEGFTKVYKRNQGIED